VQHGVLRLLEGDLMSVVGNAIIMNCRECFSRNGFGVKLVERGSAFVCDHDSSHRYVIDGESGLMKRVLPFQP